MIIYTEEINSGIGQFTLDITSTNHLINRESRKSATVINSVGYQVIIKRIKAPVDWLPSGMHVDRAEAWLFYITKVNTIPEQLRLAFRLSSARQHVQAGPDTGQGLLAIEFEDGEWQVHVGAPDDEALAWRNESIWMPERLAETLMQEKIIVTTIQEDGLVTQLPELFENEGFYLHYIMAESPRHKSLAYPEEWDVATWYAVDKSKKTLEEAWREQMGEI
jgi:hypothetical protein